MGSTSNDFADDARLFRITDKLAHTAGNDEGEEGLNQKAGQWVVGRIFEYKYHVCKKDFFSIV
jgi:hypothetical protein